MDFLSLFGQPPRRSFAEDRMENRNKEQRHEGRDRQPTDYGAGEWHVALASLADAQRHWRQADHRGEGSHQNRSDPEPSRFYHGLLKRHPFSQPVVSKSHQ